LDLGHYERYLDINLTKDSSITTGQIYTSNPNCNIVMRFMGLDRKLSS
ncbi:MAG: hypothetical protein Q8875_03130, partial [Pigeon pea little leaf phytoplasma]|nr:hypothetical protein [Pigeon pea little leaf phytoplasma]